MARAYGRGQSFDIGSQASLSELDEHPSAVEYVLGALGGDLVCGLERAAEGLGVPLHAVEIALNARLDNLLTHLGVVGERGHPGFRAIEGTMYVSSDSDQPAIESAWQRTLARSPLYNTLTRCADVTIRLAVMP
jgi:OsmC-like protein